MSAHAESQVKKDSRPTALARGVGYDTFWRGPRWVRHFTFDSMEDYLDFLGSASIQPVFADAAASERGSADFTQTESLQEAFDLARYGWHEGFNDLVRLVETMKRSLNLKLEPHISYHDYVGFVPDVKAYLEGTPTAMINRPPIHRKPIAIYVNTSYDGSATRDAIYRRGALTLGLAEVLELMGYAVDLRVFEMSSVDAEVHFSEFRLKGIDERVNLRKLHFPLCHPSWVRRLNFRLIEASPAMTEAWAGSYGIPADGELMADVLGAAEGAIIIPSIKKLGLEEDDYQASMARLIERTNPLLPADKRITLRSAGARQGAQRGGTIATREESRHGR